MLATALLEDRDGLPHFANGLKIAQHDDVIGQIAGIDISGHAVSEHTLLYAYQKGHDSALSKIGKQLMQMRCQEAFVRHRIQIAVQAVDHDHFCAPVRLPADDMGKLARRQFCRIDLLDRKLLRRDRIAQIHSKSVSAVQQIIR